MRTPSMTPSEAEAALGPRGYLKVTASNRGLIRKWLVAHNFPSGPVCGLAMKAMESAYNDTSNATLEKLRKSLERAEFDLGVGNEANGGAGNAGNAAQGNGQQANNEQAEALNEAFGNEDGDNGQQDGQQEQEQPQQKDDDGLSPLEREVIKLAERHVKIAARQAAQPKPRVIEIHRDDNPPVQINEHTAPWFERVLKLVARGENVLLVGPAGCGKTHGAEQIGKALAREYGAIHGSAGASESALTGWLLPSDGGRFEYVPSQFVELYEKGNSLFLLDELDAFDPNMLLVANGALSNGYLYIAHRRGMPRVNRGPNTAIMATANTYGTGANPMYAGRAQLDTATTDRFIIVTVDYDIKLEADIGSAAGLTKNECQQLWNIRTKARENSLRRVISTRAFAKAGALKAIGDDWKTVLDTLLEGWTRDERAKVGMA